MSRREIQVRDREGVLLVHVDGTLSASKRGQVWLALQSWCKAASSTVCGSDLKDQDTSLGQSAFTAWHFSLFAKYGQSVSGYFSIYIYVLFLLS